MLRIAAVVAALAAAVVASPAPASLAKRDHFINIHNRCNRKTVTPIYHATPNDTTVMQALAPGGSTTFNVGERQGSWRIFGEDGTGCGFPDGGRCLLLECSFDVDGYRQCNLSRVDGFNLGIEFSFDHPDCGRNDCLQSWCDGGHAFSNPDDGGPSLRQCNVPNVPMTVTFSCDF